MVKLVPVLTAKRRHELRSPAEGVVYDECLTLNDNYTVIFSFRWIRTTAYGSPRDGETDFLVFHRTKGILSIEVKGGGVAFDPVAGEWTSTDRNNVVNKIKNPFKQAEDGKHALRKYQKDEAEWSHLGLNPVRGHAVLFPDIADASRLVAPDRPAEITGTRSSLGKLEVWLDSVFAYWAGSSDQRGLTSPLNNLGMDYVDRNFCRRIEVPPLLSTVLEDEETERVRLTDEQTRTIKGLRNHQYAAVSGGAGTGKTMLAVHRAKELAGEGLNVALVCYNQPLADQLIRATENENRLHAMSFHQLCGQYIRRAKQEIGRDFLAEAKEAMPGGDHYSEHLPLAMAEAIPYANFQYDALIIDEGQDFRDEYWLPIETLRETNSRMKLLVFFDHNQQLYKPSTIFPITQPPYELTRNCRNTKIIHDLAYYFYGGPETESSDLIGEEVSPITAPSIQLQAKKLHAHLLGLLGQQKVNPHDICVVVPSDHADAHTCELITKSLPKGVRWAKGQYGVLNTICVETAMRFKGLEATYLYLWGVEYFDLEADTEMLYVTLSRAKSRLCLVGSQMHCERILTQKTGAH